MKFLSIAKPFTDNSERRRRRGCFGSQQKTVKRLLCRIFLSLALSHQRLRKKTVAVLRMQIIMAMERYSSLP
jgi:hypothetical protein